MVRVLKAVNVLRNRHRRHRGPPGYRSRRVISVAQYSRANDGDLRPSSTRQPSRRPLIVFIPNMTADASSFSPSSFSEKSFPDGATLVLPHFIHALVRGPGAPGRGMLRGVALAIVIRGLRTV